MRCSSTLPSWARPPLSASDYMSNMPGFAETLSDSDIWAILSYIKSTWPLDIQEIQSDLEDTRNQ